MTTPPKPTIREIEKWAYEELEPYFQGEYGTMDSMLEMFVTQLMEKIALLSPQTGSGTLSTTVTPECFEEILHDIGIKPQTGSGGGSADPMEVKKAVGRANVGGQVTEAQTGEGECCDKCFKWGKHYGEYVHPCNNPKCECHTRISEEMEWEKEYDKRFGFLNSIIEQYAIPNAKKVNWGQEIKAFLHKQLDLQEKRILEEHKSGIWSRKDIRGGVPCMFGTRIPVSLIEQLLTYGNTPEFIVEGYPQLSIWSVEKVRSKLSSKK